MKNTNFKFFNGKAAKALRTAAILTTIGVTACKKDAANTTTNDTVTEADAAQLTTDAVIPSTGGMVEQTNTSLSLYTATSAKLSCGDKKDTTISKTSASGVSPSYNYSLAWTYMLNCNSAIPSAFNFGFSGNSSYDGSLMSSSDSSTGTFVLSGLELSSPGYVLNTYYTRTGTETSKIARQYTFTSNLVIQSTNITVDKSSQEIVSGSATVVITGTSSSGKSFKFNGSITFLGNKKATVVLNSGASYNISWS